MNKEVRRHRSRWHLPRIVRSVRRILSRVALCRDSFERSTIRGRFGASRDGIRLAMYFELSYYPLNQSPEPTATACVRLFFLRFHCRLASAFMLEPACVSANKRIAQHRQYLCGMVLSGSRHSGLSYPSFQSS